VKRSAPRVFYRRKLSIFWLHSATSPQTCSVASMDWLACRFHECMWPVREAQAKRSHGVDKRRYTLQNAVCLRHLLRYGWVFFFDKISVKFSVFGVLYPYHSTDGVKFGVDLSPMVHYSTPNLTSSIEQKTFQSPSSNLNTGTLHFTLYIFGCACGGWNPSPTKVGTMIEDPADVFVGVRSIVSPLRDQNLGKHIHQLQTP